MRMPQAQRQPLSSRGLAAVVGVDCMPSLETSTRVV
jgi:hypothetical protein